MDEFADGALFVWFRLYDWGSGARVGGARLATENEEGSLVNVSKLIAIVSEGLRDHEG